MLSGSPETCNFAVILFRYQMTLRTFPAWLLMVAATSCTTEFDAYVESDPIPVLYGMINPSDSIHTVRLSRSFVGPGNALDYAKRADIIFYEGAEVWMETRTQHGKLIQKADLTEQVVHDRDEGVFVSRPNLVYQARSDQIRLRPEEFAQEGIDYNAYLYIFARIPGEEYPIYSFALLQPPPRITKPQFTFNKVYFYGDVPFGLEWVHSVPNNTFEIIVRLNYLEVREEEEVRTSAEWVLRGITYNEASSPTGVRLYYAYYFRPETFYSQVRANIKPNPEVLARVLKTIDFYVNSTDKSFRFYQEVNNISDDYHEAGYTNVVNGIGFFSTFTTISLEGLHLGYRELDSLANGMYTKHLHFAPWD